MRRHQKVSQPAPSKPASCWPFPIRVSIALVDGGFRACRRQWNPLVPTPGSLGRLVAGEDR
jgi:hypothetical protein